MIVIDRKAPWIPELARLVAFLAELGHKLAFVNININTNITREYLRSMIEEIKGEQETSMMVERHAKRAVELTIMAASALGANRASIQKMTIHLDQCLFQSRATPRSDDSH